MALPACASVTISSASASYPAERQIVYNAAQRIIGLPDGSEAVIYQPDVPNDRPAAMRVFILAPSPDREGDRGVRLELFIPDEIEPGYPGQIRSVAMSDDHKRLALIGGWFSARDKHGHNGIFILRLDEQHGSVWRLQSWFDVKELALGDLTFGPDDLLIVTSRPHDAAEPHPPLVTLFSLAGQNIGSFIAAENRSGSILETRLARVSDDTVGLYDPQGGRVRFLRIAKNTVRQERAVAIPFPTEGVNLVGFDPRPDGRVVLGRTIAADHRAKTFITVIDPSGKVIEEWPSPQPWRYGYADGKRVLRGFESAPGGVLNATALTVP